MLAGLVAFIAFKLFSGSGNQAPAQAPYMNTSNGVPSGITATTNNPSGGQITADNTNTIKDFINDPATVQDPINAGQYYLGYHFNEGILDATATDSPPYVIDYFSATNYFNIVLFQEPIREVRLQAEQYLMAKLGISQDQMCQLKYTVTVPIRVSQIYAGTNLGFSFCPGSTPL